MTRFLMICATCLTAGCSEPITEYVYLTPDVPADLFEPKVVEARVLNTVGELAEDRTAQKEAAETNAEKIVSIKCIWDAAKDGEAIPPDDCFG